MNEPAKPRTRAILEGLEEKSMNERAKPRTRVGAAVMAWGQSVELTEDLYQESEGEVTGETQAAELFAELNAAQALEQLGRFDTWLQAQALGIKAEVERLAEAAKGVKSRSLWVQEKARAILESLGKKSTTAGTFKVKSTAGRWRCEAEAGLDATQLPAECRRWVEPVEGKWQLDKVEALKYISADTSLPVEGLRRVQGVRSVRFD